MAIKFQFSVNLSINKSDRCMIHLVLNGKVNPQRAVF